MLPKCGATALGFQQQQQVGTQEAKAFVCSSKQLAAEADTHAAPATCSKQSSMVYASMAYRILNITLLA
jgi:hypothetical protein